MFWDYERTKRQQMMPVVMKNDISNALRFSWEWGNADSWANTREMSGLHWVLGRRWESGCWTLGHRRMDEGRAWKRWNEGKFASELLMKRAEWGCENGGMRTWKRWNDKLGTTVWGRKGSFCGGLGRWNAFLCLLRCLERRIGGMLFLQYFSYLLFVVRVLTRGILNRCEKWNWRWSKRE